MFRRKGKAHRLCNLGERKQERIESWRVKIHPIIYYIAEKTQENAESFKYRRRKRKEKENLK